MAVLMQGLEWAAGDAARRGVWNRAVFSISIGGDFSPAVNNLIDQLVWQGITIVVAAGNDNKDVASVSPASAEQALTAAASDVRNARAYFSNYGNLVDIFAPGLDIWSASHLSDDLYVSKSGTSMGKWSEYSIGLINI
jgi:oryzin